MPAKIVAKVTPIKIHAVTATKLSLLKVFGINKFLSDSIRPNFELQWINLQDLFYIRIEGELRLGEVNVMITGLGHSIKHARRLKSTFRSKDCSHIIDNGIFSIHYTTDLFVPQRNDAEYLALECKQKSKILIPWMSIVDSQLN